MNKRNAILSSIWAQLCTIEADIKAIHEDLNDLKQPEVTRLEDLKEPWARRPTADEILKEEVQVDADEQAMRNAKEMAEDDIDPLAPFA